MTELNIVLRILSLSTGMELYHDIFMKCLSLHSVDIAQDHTDGIGHTSAEKKYRAKKLILLKAKNMVQNRS